MDSFTNTNFEKKEEGVYTQSQKDYGHDPFG